jgi:hypothetical protein
MSDERETAVLSVGAGATVIDGTLLTVPPDARDGSSTSGGAGSGGGISSSVNGSGSGGSGSGGGSGSSSGRAASAGAIDASPATAHFRAYAARDPWLLAHKGVYFVAMGASGAYYPFLVLYLVEAQVVESYFEAGVLMAVSHTAAMLFAPPLTALADRGARWRRAVLLASLASAAVLIAAMSTARSYAAVMVAAIAVDAEESVQGRGDAVLGSVGGGTCSLLASTAAAWSTRTFSCSSTTVA